MSALLPYHISGINRDGDIAHIRSHSCTGIASLGRKSCNACIEQVHSREVQLIVRRAMTETPVNGLNIKYYTFKQLAELLDAKDEQLKKYRLKVCAPSQWHI
jgi:hypothetical protein